MFLLSLIQRRLGGGLESLDAAVAAGTDPWRSSPERGPDSASSMRSSLTKPRHARVP